MSDLLFSTSLASLAIISVLIAGPAAAQSAEKASPPAAAAPVAAVPHVMPGKTRLTAPRIVPLEESAWTGDQTKELTPYKEPLQLFGTQLKVHNVMLTLAQHEEARKKFNVWANHVMGATSTLPPRERELLILRIGWLCQAEYEWGQHAVIGKAVGLTDEEIARIKLGPDAAGWDPFDAALLRAADELRKDAFVSDATWGALAKRYNTQQLMDVVFTVGQYNLVSMALNSFGVQLDEGVKGF
jgi:alkylhydroperoxidase family enzyme